MAKKKKTYQRMPGKGKSLFGYSTLWLGPDHLLSVDSRVFTEDYKRFYFRDIQSIVCRKTAVGNVWTGVLAVMGTLFLIPALFSDIEPIPFWIITGFFFAFLIINIWRGPTCACHIQTAVQTEKLPSFNRLNNFKKGMERLTPHIDRAQGPLPPDALETFSPGSAPSRSRENRPVYRVTSALRPIRHEGGRVHLALFALMMVDCLFSAIPFFFRHPGLTLTASLITMGACVCLIIALVKQHGSDISGALRAVTWTSMGYFCINFITGYIVFFVIIFKNPRMAQNQWEIIKMLAEISPYDNPYMLGIYLFGICGSGILGITGLILLKRFYSAYETALHQASPPPRGAADAA